MLFPPGMKFVFLPYECFGFLSVCSYVFWMKRCPCVFGRAFSFILTQFTQELLWTVRCCLYGAFYPLQWLRSLWRPWETEQNLNLAISSIRQLEQKEKSVESGSRMLCTKQSAVSQLCAHIHTPAITQFQRRNPNFKLPYWHKRTRRKIAASTLQSFSKKNTTGVYRK